jgi:hypothetical protein
MWTIGKESHDKATPIAAQWPDFFFWYISGATAAIENRAMYSYRSSIETCSITDTSIIYPSLASGVGFALMRALMMYGTVLASSVQGQGAAFTDTCPLIPLVYASGMMIIIFITFWWSLYVYACIDRW